ncbi:hypothetical protein NC652_018681 [Populus alba x Populus x berolinensis]|uniref:Uncharacterized protein n=1 Tax=Populus tomentosa TaxID=118781 RepID=A0A8X8CM31_POPTO|nr:hypothetical protein POTOM_026870 [Populus tomentosa]KAJ6916072.1 hypothetical protein NC652_018681 [Populus alba x Populus x berolinensis]
MGSREMEGQDFENPLQDTPEKNIENDNTRAHVTDHGPVSAHSENEIINSELSKRLQIKYYELCCSQKRFLHDHLVEYLNCELVVGMIAESFNIADAIKASTVTTFQDSFKKWKKTLKAFQGLGMNVGFAC